MGEALRKRADTIITVGAVQSNHVRQTAAAACKLGMKCEVLLEHRVADPSELVPYFRQCAARPHLRGEPARISKRARILMWRWTRLRMRCVLPAARRTSFLVAPRTPSGRSATSAVAKSCCSSCDEQDLKIDHIVTATGSAGTHARPRRRIAWRAAVTLPILGIGVNAPQDVQEERVFRSGLWRRRNCSDRPGCVSARTSLPTATTLARAMGEPTESMNEAVLMLARQEGLLFDPVYSGKALAGMIDYIRQGRFELASEDCVPAHRRGRRSVRLRGHPRSQLKKRPTCGGLSESGGRQGGRRRDSPRSKLTVNVTVIMRGGP